MKYIIKEEEIDLLFETDKDSVICSQILDFVTNKKVNKLIDFAILCMNAVQDIERIDKTIHNIGVAMGEWGPIIRYMFHEEKEGKDVNEIYQTLYNESRAETWTEIQEDAFHSLLEDHINSQLENEDGILGSETREEKKNPGKDQVNPARREAKTVAYLLENIRDVYKFKLDKGSLVKTDGKLLLLHPACATLNEYFKVVRRDIEREEIILSDVSRLFIRREK